MFNLFILIEIRVMEDLMELSFLAFVVKYKIGEDVDLAEHFDNAEVTLNVSLSETYTGKY